MYRASQTLAQLKMAVTHGLRWPACRLAGRHTDAAPKHSLLFQFSFRVICHAHCHTFAKRKLYRLLIVIIVRR